MKARSGPPPPQTGGGRAGHRILARPRRRCSGAPLLMRTGEGEEKRERGRKRKNTEPKRDLMRDLGIEESRAANNKSPP